MYDIGYVDSEYSTEDIYKSDYAILKGYMLALLAQIGLELSSDKTPDKKFIQTCLDAFNAGLDRL